MEDCHVGKNIEFKIWKILKSKTDSDVNMKQDLFEFGFELHLSDGFVKQKKNHYIDQAHMFLLYSSPEDEHVRRTKNILV